MLTQRSPRTLRGELIWECEIRNSEFEKIEGRKPYYAPNPLRGACFAKASQPEGAEKLPASSRKCGTSEDMPKGARDGPRQEYGAGGWEGGVEVGSLSVGDLGDVAPT